MKCSDIMTTNLEWLSTTDTILHAATVMADTGTGFLPVCDENMRVLGVITDRDLTVRALAKNVAAATTPAMSVMSSPAVTLQAGAAIEDAEELMASECKARLAITDADGRLVGVLGLADLVEKAAGGKVMHTLKAVLWREALGPRGGAQPGDPLLQNDPEARLPDPAAEQIQVRDSVFINGPRPEPNFNKVFP